MSDFKPEDVAKLAALARIKLSAAEEKKLAGDIDSILSYVSAIAGIAEEVPEENPLRNVMRADELPHEAGLHTEELLRAAPRREGNHVAVKKIISK